MLIHANAVLESKRMSSNLHEALQAGLYEAPGMHRPEQLQKASVQLHNAMQQLKDDSRRLSQLLHACR